MDKYWSNKNMPETKVEVSKPLESKVEVSKPLETKVEVSKPLESKVEVSKPLESKVEVSKPPETKGEPKNLLIITGTSAKLNGIIEVSEDIEINCEITGELKVGGKLTIQKDARISSGVTAKDVKIIGQYKGNMEATGEVTIVKGGVMNGNIVTDKLVINEGGIFSGKVTRTDEVDKENTLVKKTHLGYTPSDEDTPGKKLSDFNKI